MQDMMATCRDMAYVDITPVNDSPSRFHYFGNTMMCFIPWIIWIKVWDLKYIFSKFDDNWRRLAKTNKQIKEVFLESQMKKSPLKVPSIFCYDLRHTQNCLITNWIDFLCAVVQMLSWCIILQLIFIEFLSLFSGEPIPFVHLPEFQRDLWWHSRHGRQHGYGRHVWDGQNANLCKYGRNLHCKAFYVISYHYLNVLPNSSCNPQFT